MHFKSTGIILSYFPANENNNYSYLRIFPLKIRGRHRYVGFGSHRRQLDTGLTCQMIKGQEALLSCPFALALEIPGLLQDHWPASLNGCCNTKVSSRSGPVETMAIGRPTSSEIRWM